MVPATARQEGGDLIVEGADLEVRIGLTDGAFAARRLGGEDVRSTTRRPLLSLLTAGHETRAIQLAVALTDDEALYGTGSVSTRSTGGACASTRASTNSTKTRGRARTYPSH